MNEPIPLARPELGEREEALVLEVLQSGTLSLGPKLSEFERGFAERLDAAEAVAVSSGTAALHLGVRALGWGRGDQVITTPLSFVASANCLMFEDATPVFCDIDPVTLCLAPEAVAAAVDERTAGILPVDIYGYPADLPAIERIAAQRGIGLLEDACQALGAVDAAGRQVGSAGHPTAFAFYANKQITTGEGGVLALAGAALAARARSERNQGRSADMGVVEHERLGFNYRLTDIQAAIGIAQLERLEELLSARGAVASAYRARLSALGAVDPEDVDGADASSALLLPCADRGSERRSWFVFCVQLPVEADRDEVIGSLEAAGIQSKAYLPCIHTMPFYRERFGFEGGEFPVAERVAERSLALPFYSSMSEEQVERVCMALAEALNLRP